MTKLSANQESFIDTMCEGEEFAFRGFELLVQQGDPALFFDGLQKAGLLAPSNNQGPVPADQPGYFRIPYWPALDYLVVVARQADASHDLNLAKKVISVVSAATNQKDKDGNRIDNYHTYRKFAEILGTLPIEAVTDDLVELVQIWLAGRFDSGLVGNELGSKVIPRFLASDIPGAVEKACRILAFCTRVKWVDQKFGESTRKEPVTTLEDYWLGELIKKTAGTFGRRAGRIAIDAVRENLLELFKEQNRKQRSWLWRPAIEDHAQNQVGREPENRLIDAVRDILLSWLDTDLASAKPYVANMISYGPEILRRIGIYALNVRFDQLRDLVPQTLAVAFVDTNLLHESYDFLAAHFTQLTDAEKKEVLQSFGKIVVDSSLDQHEKRLKSIQRRWLSAIVRKGYEPADKWFAQLSVDLGYAADEEDSHPNFHSYMESYWGFGKSPYPASEVVEFARQKTFVSKVNEFGEAGHSMRGPTVRGLVDAIEEAVGLEPNLFINNVASFDDAKNQYKYAILSGAKKLWDKHESTPDDLDWAQLWKSILEYLDKLTSNERFWTEPDEPSDGDVPDRRWISTLISDFLRAGTNKDAHSYPANLLPLGERILLRVLERAETDDDDESSDPMTHALNTVKGRAIEALVSHTLRACRISDKDGKGHAKEWERLRGVYDRELAKCTNSNFDFSTLIGAYIENLSYVSDEWVATNLKKIFPLEYANSLKCAFDGLAHAPASKRLYDRLSDHGVIIHALHNLPDTRHGRENLLQRIALAYLWKCENLDGPVFSDIKSRGAEEDAAEIGRWLWSLRRSDVTPEQVKQILAFWTWCLGWVSHAANAPSRILSKLGLLACYIDQVDDTTMPLLMAVAPRMKDEHHDGLFTKELVRLVEVEPRKIGLILKEMLSGFPPDFDYEGSLATIVHKVADVDKPLALELANKLRKIRGFLDIYEGIVHKM